MYMEEVYEQVMTCLLATDGAASDAYTEISDEYGFYPLK